MAECKYENVNITLSYTELQVFGMVLININYPLSDIQKKAVESMKQAIKPFWVNGG